MFLRSGNLGGPASKLHGDKLGLYIAMEGSQRNGRPVYRHEGGDAFLHFNDWGLDLVSGKDAILLFIQVGALELSL